MRWQRREPPDLSRDTAAPADAAAGTATVAFPSQVSYQRNSIYLALARVTTFDDPEALLKALPILTKSDVRNGFDGLKSLDLGRRPWFYNASGGSTGDPVRLIQDHDFRDSQRATRLLFDTWTGYRIGMRKVIFWGSDSTSEARLSGTRLYRWLANEVWKCVCRGCRCGAVGCEPIARPIRQVLAYVDSLFHWPAPSNRPRLPDCPAARHHLLSGYAHRPTGTATEPVFEAACRPLRVP